MESSSVDLKEKNKYVTLLIAVYDKRTCLLSNDYKHLKHNNATTNPVASIGESAGGGAADRPG